jgi:hypothetical protein
VITLPIARRVIVPQESIAHETSAMPGRFSIGNVDASRHGPCVLFLGCYLDIRNAACVRWNNFNDGAKTYQGELVGKDRFKNAFLSQQTRADGYDYSK